MSQPKYAEVAARVRAQVEDGTLAPGQPAPSGAALARATGYSILTCRRALRTLTTDGVLVPGPSPNARLRVPAPAPVEDGPRADAARELSTALATRRRAAGLKQPQLAEIIGVSITTVGHAETGRTWQSRGFWERVDKALNADGELLSRHDAYRAATIAVLSSAGQDETNSTPGASPRTTEASISAPVCVTITWANGAVTTVYPPREASRPPQSSPPQPA